LLYLLFANISFCLASKKTNFACFPFANISTKLKYKQSKGAKQACSKTKLRFVKQRPFVNKKTMFFYRQSKGRFSESLPIKKLCFFIGYKNFVFISKGEVCTRVANLTSLGLCLTSKASP
jgi:hypothetical protein